MTAPTADPETRLAAGDHEALRLWLRLFTVSTMVERTIGAHLKREFGSSLPRFDLLAQLERAPDGLRMAALSERLLVTGGNVTFLVNSLEAEGLVARRRAPEDGRSWIVALTPEGRRAFDRMARAHERWIDRLFRTLAPRERTQLHALLGTLKSGIRPEVAP
jgi:DNA-binding MarR family transcriptional regulator